MKFLKVSDVGIVGLRTILNACARIKTSPDDVRGLLSGTSVGIFFEKPSTRTRVSCEVAAVHLGAHPVMLRGEEIGFGNREETRDIARVLERYVDALAFRVFRHRDLEELVAHTDMPVINLLSDLTHPCQAVADLATIEESMDLAGSTLAYVGDGNNVLHSLLLAGAMTGMHIIAATPRGYEPAAEIVAEARKLAGETGASITLTSDPAAAVRDADVVYTDVWTSMGQEAEAAHRAADFAGFQVDLDLFETADPNALFLHCLPAHRGEEVTDQVMEHVRSRVFDQAENRMHAFAAVLLYTTGTLPSW